MAKTKMGGKKGKKNKFAGDRWSKGGKLALGRRGK
jgi:hypothetical protein